MNMTKLILILLTATLCTTGCKQYSSAETGYTLSSETIKGNGKYVTKKIDVDKFSGIALTGSFSVKYVQKKGEPSVDVYGESNIVDHLDIHTENSTLYLSLKNGNYSFDRLEVRVSSPTADCFSLTGSGDIIMSGNLKTRQLSLLLTGSGDIKFNRIDCENLNVKCTGSGDINVQKMNCVKLFTTLTGSGDIRISNIDCNDVNAALNGSGDLLLSGEASKASYNLHGSGDIDAQNLTTDKSKATIGGSGDIKCNAETLLKARTTGSGSIRYKGNPKVDKGKDDDVSRL